MMRNLIGYLTLNTHVVVIIIITILSQTSLVVVLGSSTRFDEDDNNKMKMSSSSSSSSDEEEALKYKLIAIASILAAGAVGVSLPLLARKVEALRPENDMFFMVKAFAAGVILATGFLHILPDAFRTLTSPSLDQNPWGEFPFAGFVAMVACIGTLIIDTFATNFYKKIHFKRNNNNDDDGDDEEALSASAAAAAAVTAAAADDDVHAGHVHIHTHATHGHAHGASVPSRRGTGLSPSELIRQRVISQVLELGIVVHSIIIGMSLGASQRPETIKPLLAALSFHQFFEGMGLGGCISQAKFKSMSTVIMAIFFSVTAPTGVGIGIGISSVYNNNNNSTAFIVEGILNSASAGILIYMSLVDLLATDLMSPRLQNNLRLQFGAFTSLLLGAACMSFMARWS